MLYMFLSEGFEELEAVAPLDLLRRADMDVHTVGVTGKTVAGSHKIQLTCDEVLLSDWRPAAECMGVILPGGSGFRGLDLPEVMEAVDTCAARGKLVAAICAAPSLLGKRGLLIGRRACCYPGYEAQLEGAEIMFDSVVTDGNIITARGAGAAVAFGLALVEYTRGTECAAQLAEMIQCP
ncbi:MAG: DJ-1/PfpI family protein [Oscillospiraceae bacterium]|jgi:4-methyl-5(b-hydroxyethyl)-thiazole monophosphate biosynthesis|nr:DJ-1/PfpI family protein [Oscillospiraceae bacterium]